MFGDGTTEEKETRPLVKEEGKFLDLKREEGAVWNTIRASQIGLRRACHAKEAHARAEQYTPAVSKRSRPCAERKMRRQKRNRQDQNARSQGQQGRPEVHGKKRGARTKKGGDRGSSAGKKGGPAPIGSRTLPRP